MPLTEFEKEGFATMLQLLPRDDLLSLQSTVTNSLVHTTDVAETISSIISFTQTPGDLLKRKKLKKEIMLKYLHQRNANIDASKDKKHVAQEVLRHWGSSQTEVMDVEEDDLVSIYNAGDSCSSSTFDNTPVSPSFIIQSTMATPNLGLPFAEQFTKWFYSMLNSKNPNMTNAAVVPEFDESHFYSDCWLVIVKDSVVRQERFEHFGAGGVHSALSSLVVAEGLAFNAGSSSVLEENHGLVVVTAHGTLHQAHGGTAHQCVGTFDQRFQLVSDPFKQSNWAIKASELLLKQSAHAQNAIAPS